MGHGMVIIQSYFDLLPHKVKRRVQKQIGNACVFITCHKLKHQHEFSAGTCEYSVLPMHIFTYIKYSILSIYI